MLNNGPDGPAMDVDLGGVNAGEKDVGQDHHAEGLVDLPQVHLTRLEQRGTRIGGYPSAGGGGGALQSFWLFIIFLLRPIKSYKIKYMHFYFI